MARQRGLISGYRLIFIQSIEVPLIRDEADRAQLHLCAFLEMRSLPELRSAFIDFSVAFHEVFTVSCRSQIYNVGRDVGRTGASVTTTIERLSGKALLLTIDTDLTEAQNLQDTIKLVSADMNARLDQAEEPQTLVIQDAQHMRLNFRVCGSSA